jgi:hypothetical protein
MSLLLKDVTSGFMDQPGGTSPHGWLRYYPQKKICDTRASVRQRSGEFPSHPVGRSCRYSGQVNPRLGSDILSTKLVQRFRYSNIWICPARHQYLNHVPPTIAQRIAMPNTLWYHAKALSVEPAVCEVRDNAFSFRDTSARPTIGCNTCFRLCLKRLAQHTSSPTRLFPDVPG